MPVSSINNNLIQEEVSNQRFYEYLDRLKTKFPFKDRITLIHCPTFNFESFNINVARNRAYYAYPPTGLQCLKATLSDFKIEVDILDLNFLLLERVCKSQPDDPLELTSLLDKHFLSNETSLVGVSAGVTVSNIFEIENHPFIQTLKYLMQRDRHIVIAGGVIANNEWKSLLRKNLAHFVFEGEAENKLAYFSRQLMGQSVGSPMSGIYFKYDQQVEKTRGEEDIVNFQGNLIPSYQKIPTEDYNKVGCLGPFSRMVNPDHIYGTVQLVRGCRAKCSFCGVTPFMGSVRLYSVDKVIEEIIYLVRKRGVKHIEWLDDDFLANREAVVELLQKLIDLNLNLTWAANNGLIASFLDEELLKLMVASGCIGFRIGIESGNDEVLKKIQKPATKHSLRNASNLLAQFPEIFAVGCYIIGFEDETVGQIYDTFKFSLEMNLSWGGFSECQLIGDGNVDDEFEVNQEATFNQTQKKVTDFVPSKETTDRTINANLDDWKSIFSLPKDSIPSEETLHEMWFSFNLMTNYVFNKNLLPNGSLNRFIRWVKILQLSYPENAVMCLFLYLAHILAGEEDKAFKQIARAKEILSVSDYWNRRFKKFHLDNVIKNPPANKKQTQQTIQQLRDRFDDEIKKL